MIPHCGSDLHLEKGLLRGFGGGDTQQALKLYQTPSRVFSLITLSACHHLHESWASIVYLIWRAMHRQEGLEEASILLVSPFIPLQDGDNSGYFTLGLL